VLVISLLSISVQLLMDIIKTAHTLSVLVIRNRGKKKSPILCGRLTKPQ